MAKKQIKQTPLQHLNDKMQVLMKKRLQAANAGASFDIMQQLDTMIAETQIEIYAETELERHRRSDKGDGESFIV